MPILDACIVGKIYLPEIWSGPIVPPSQPPGGGLPPLGIWGPTDPRPTPPIYFPPQQPPSGGPPVVTPPIYYPPVPGWPSIPPYPGQMPPGTVPPQIWPSPGHPAHPIVIPPPPGGGEPPVIWPGPGIPPEGQAPLPEHPIVIPPPGEPPTEPPGLTDPGHWGYSLKYGCVWVPAGPGGKPHPPVPPESGTEPPPTDPNAPVVNPLPG